MESVESKSDHRPMLQRKASRVVRDEVRTPSQELMEAKDPSEGTIVWCVAAFLTYFAVGVTYGIWTRGWNFAVAFYFTTATITTVGYGDFSFTTPDDKPDGMEFFGCFFVFFGVVFIGAAAGAALDSLAARSQLSLDERIENLKKQAADEAARCIETGEACPGQIFDEEHRIRRLYQRLLTRELPTIAGTVVVGTLVMMQLEDDWDFPTGFYWCCVTMTTVGYGDMLPTNDYSKLFAAFYMLMSFGVITSALGFLAGIPFEIRKIKNMSKILNQFGDSLDEEELLALVDSREVRRLRTKTQDAHDNSIYGPSATRVEFLLWQLLKQGKIDFDADIAPSLHIFDSLDTDASGFLGVEDIEQAKREEEAVEATAVEGKDEALTPSSPTWRSSSTHRTAPLLEAQTKLKLKLEETESRMAQLEARSKGLCGRP